MFYSYPCPVCGSVLFTFNEHGESASQTLYNGLEAHMKSYQELEKDSDNLDHVGKEYQDLSTVYAGMSSSPTKPEGGFDLG